MQILIQLQEFQKSNNFLPFKDCLCCTTGILGYVLRKNRMTESLYIYRSIKAYTSVYPTDDALTVRNLFREILFF